jgi:ribonuclease J
MANRKSNSGGVPAKVSGGNDELVFLPLGGCNEIGMNLNAYGYGPPTDRKWILVDVGVTFGDDRTPGVDLIMPDPEFLEGEAHNILAIILTHAHEDHIGAIGHLWPRIKAPVYATPFTAELVKDKLNETGLDKQVELHTVPLGAELEFGPFKVEFVTLTHSIPEPNGLAITTPLGLILHTGDWKIDPDPMIGDDFDQAAIERLGKAGVLAMVCDSTNVFVEGEAGSEGDVRKELIKLIGELSGRVAVTGFASNVARVESIAMAAEANGRRVCLVGRSMHRITNAAKTVGLLQGLKPFIEDDEAGRFPPDKILYLCTGSQGEPRAALSRIARGDHPHVRLGKGDTIVFSSRVIPGNEKAIFAMQDSLAEQGVRLITERVRDVHVSGHPCRDELRRMYQWAKPQIAVPVHGERRHILEHAAFALTLQVPQSVAPRNGDMIRLAPGEPVVIDEVPSGRLLLDGKRLVPEGAMSLKDRRRIAQGGYLAISVVLDGKGRIKDGPAILARGLSEVDGGLADASLEALEDAAEEAINRLKPSELDDDMAIERSVIRSVRKAADITFGKRPLMDVLVLRV